MIALVHHIRMVHARSPYNLDLIELFLLIHDLLNSLAVAQEKFHLILLVLLKLSKLLLLRLNENLLED